MDTYTVIIILGLFVILGGMIFIIWKISNLQKTADQPNEPQSLLLMQQQLSQLQQEVNSRLGETNQTFREQHQSVAGIVRDVTSRMAKVEEISRQVLHETTELQKLQQMLKNPKQRGILGEYFLETLLKNTMPPGSFEMQYKFKDG